MPSERFFTQGKCEPRTFCSILKDYIITEPQLIRDVLQPYQRLKEEERLITESNNIFMNFTFNSTYTESRNNTYWTTYDGISLENDFGSKNFFNTWSLNTTWQPFDRLDGINEREDRVKNEIKNYFYLARLQVFKILNIFVQLRSPNNIFSVITASRVLDFQNFVIPKIQDFFKKETFLYKQKLVNMESLLALYDSYNGILQSKINNHNSIHFYQPKYYRLKNLVLNSIDAISIEFLDYVESHLDLSDYKVCTKKAYLEESVKRSIFNLKLAYNESQMRLRDNFNGFSLNLNGELNEPMNFGAFLGYNLSYQVLETDANKLARWDYIIARKNISDDFTKAIELEKDFLNETFLMTQSSLEGYLQAKENRELVYLILKGKVINKLGDKNFKFGFTDITEKSTNLLRVLSAEMFLVKTMYNFSNALFVGLSQCALAEEIVEEIKNL